MKILHILTSDRFSGAENVAIKIIQNLETQFEFAYASPTGSISTTLSEVGINHFEMKKFSLAELSRVISLYKPDIIHAHDYTASVYSTFVSMGKNIEIISHLHNNATWIKSLGKNTVSYLLSTFKYKKIICVSPSIKNEFLMGNLFFRKAIVLPNVVDANEIINFSKIDVIKDSYDIGYVGRLAEAKDPLRFIKIIKEIKNKYGNIKAFMAGDGPLYDECINLIEKLGLENNIKILGFTQNPYKYIANTKLMIVPSLYEGFGLVAVESLVLGKPVLVSNTGGLPKIINDSCGKVCNSDLEFVESSLVLLMDNERYKLVKNKCIERSLKFSDVYSYFTNISALYSSVRQGL